MAAGSAIISAISLGVQIRQGRKAEKQQEEATEAQESTARAQNARARRRQVAQARRARAEALVQGAGQGVSDSSVVQGATGSLQTQEATNISFINQLETFDLQRLSAQNKANRALGRAATAGAVGRFAQSGAGVEGLEKIESFFKE